MKQLFSFKYSKYYLSQLFKIIHNNIIKIKLKKKEFLTKFQTEMIKMDITSVIFMRVYFWKTSYVIQV